MRKAIFVSANTFPTIPLQVGIYYLVTFTPNVTREVICNENFVVTIPD